VYALTGLGELTAAILWHTELPFIQERIMPSVQEVTKMLSDNAAVVPGKLVRLDFGNEGSIFLDGVTNAVNNNREVAADTTIKVSFADFLALADGSLNGTMAFMQGKLQVEGDMSAAMQLQQVTAKIKK
jgi:putative sterol carrier protein